MKECRWCRKNSKTLNVRLERKETDKQINHEDIRNKSKTWKQKKTREKVEVSGGVEEESENMDRGKNWEEKST